MKQKRKRLLRGEKVIKKERKKKKDSINIEGNQTPNRVADQRAQIFLRITKLGMCL